MESLLYTKQGAMGQTAFFSAEEIRKRIIELALLEELKGSMQQ